MGFTTTVKMTEGGRIVIPLEVRNQLGLQVGSELVLTMERDQAVLKSRAASIQQAQNRLRKYAARGRGSALASDSLIADRRKEAARE